MANTTYVIIGTNEEWTGEIMEWPPGSGIHVTTTTGAYEGSFSREVKVSEKNSSQSFRNSRQKKVGAVDSKPSMDGTPTNPIKNGKNIDTKALSRTVNNMQNTPIQKRSNRSKRKNIEEVIDGSDTGGSWAGGSRQGNVADRDWFDDPEKGGGAY